MNAIERGSRGADPDLDSTSDLDEPMGSQSADVEAPLTHNSSKSNFFASPDSEQVSMLRCPAIWSTCRFINHSKKILFKLS